MNTGRGRHPWKATRADGTYPFPAHGGLNSEVDDVYTRGVCRKFGIDETEYRALL